MNYKSNDIELNNAIKKVKKIYSNSKDEMYEVYEVYDLINPNSKFKYQIEKNTLLLSLFIIINYSFNHTKIKNLNFIYLNKINKPEYIEIYNMDKNIQNIINSCDDTRNFYKELINKYIYNITPQKINLYLIEFINNMDNKNKVKQNIYIKK